MKSMPLIEPTVLWKTGTRTRGKNHISVHLLTQDVLVDFGEMVLLKYENSIPVSHHEGLPWKYTCKDNVVNVPPC